MIIMIVLFGLALYATYASYQKYTTAQNSTKLSSFLSELESLLYKLETERINSAIYLAAQRKSNFDKLKESQSSVDLKLTQFDTFLKQNSGYEPYSKETNVIRRELIRVRKEVEGESNTYRNILFEDYHSTIVGSLLKMLNTISLTEKFEPIKNNLSMYEQYTQLKENSVLENMGIYFVLLGSKKMSDADITLWDHLRTKDILPRFNLLVNSKVAVEIEALLSSDEFNSIASRERNMILNEARKGEYSVSPVSWVNQINKKMDYFTKVQSLLHSEIQKMEQAFLSDSRKIILWYVIGLLALFLLLVRLVVMYMKIVDGKKISENILGDIPLVLSRNQQV